MISSELPDILPETQQNHSLTVSSDSPHLGSSLPKSPPSSSLPDIRSLSILSDESGSSSEEVERENLCNQIQKKKIKKKDIRQSRDKKKIKKQIVMSSGDNDTDETVVMKGRYRITMSQNYKSTILRGFGRVLVDARTERSGDMYNILKACVESLESDWEPLGLTSLEQACKEVVDYVD